MKKVRAAGVDIGTNSVRLLVADAGSTGAPPSLRTLQRLMRITRLGRGVDETGVLDGDAVRLTLAVLRDYRALMREKGVEACEVAATSAARDAANAEDFLRQAEEIIGTRPRVLSGGEEAQLSFLGSTYDLGPLQPSNAPVLVVDIGGGSTEIIVGRNGDILEELSLDIGCVRMSERFLASDPPRAQELGKMEEYARSALAPHTARISGHAPGLVVGLAGTVTTLSGLRQGLDRYDGDAIHHSWLSREDVEGLYRRLCSLSLDERKKFMRLESGRADVIIGGTAVLLALLRGLGVERLLVSEKDILDGLVLTAAGYVDMPR